MWPDFCHIKDVPPVLFCLIGCHCLDISGPAWVISFCDVLEQILDIMVRVFSRNLCGLCLGEVLDALVGLQVDFDIDERSILCPISQCPGNAGQDVNHLPSW